MLTWVKLKNEKVSAREKVKLAEIDKNNADIKLGMHELRAVLPYKTYTIKNIQRPAGTFLKQLDPVVMTVQSLERLLAEASIEEQYFTRFKDQKYVTATIEPTVLEAPTHELHGHDADVNCVAVAKDLSRLRQRGSARSASGSRTRRRAAQVRARRRRQGVACTPAKAKRNLCVVGCADGDIWLWDLDAKETTSRWSSSRSRMASIITITALAFSPKGDYFASGGSDGSIRLWTTERERQIRRGEIRVRARRTASRRRTRKRSPRCTSRRNAAWSRPRATRR